MTLSDDLVAPCGVPDLMLFSLRESVCVCVCVCSGGEDQCVFVLDSRVMFGCARCCLSFITLSSRLFSDAAGEIHKYRTRQNHQNQAEP